MKNTAFLVQIDRKMNQILGEDLPVLKKIKKFVVQSGGKRLRPLVHFYFTQMLGYKGKQWQDIGAIGEIIHAASLLHDDVVDDSSERRGKPAVHTVYDNKTAILSGDYLLGCAFDHLRSLGRLDDFYRIFTRVIRLLSVGELIQMQWENNSKITMKIYNEIILCKTAVLFGAMTESAALLSDVKPDRLLQYKDFGETLGRIFQIRDDYLDYFSSGSKMGKSVYQDFERGILTYPVLTLREKMSFTEKRKFMAFWNSDEKRKSDTGRVMMQDYFDQYSIQNTLETGINRSIKNLNQFLGQHPASSFRDKLIEKIRQLGVKNQ